MSEQLILTDRFSEQRQLIADVLAEVGFTEVQRHTTADFFTLSKTRLMPLSLSFIAIAVLHT